MKEEVFQFSLLHAAQQSVAAVNRSCHVACLRKRRAKPPPQDVNEVHE